jgi:hypothetical protein
MSNQRLPVVVSGALHRPDQPLGGLRNHHAASSGEGAGGLDLLPLPLVELGDEVDRGDAVDLAVGVQ